MSLCNDLLASLNPRPFRWWSHQVVPMNPHWTWRGGPYRHNTWGSAWDHAEALAQVQDQLKTNKPAESQKATTPGIPPEKGSAP